jgi:hypothetical protein
MKTMSCVYNYSIKGSNTNALMTVDQSSRSNSIKVNWGIFKPQNHQPKEYLNEMQQKEFV